MIIEAVPGQIRPGDRNFHVIDARQQSREWLQEVLFPLSAQMEQLLESGERPTSLQGRRFCSLFFEASTRTRLSFQSAIELLGGTVNATENAKEFSSAVKGESMKDTGKTIDRYYYDGVVMRSHYAGAAAELAAGLKRAKVFNAGDGKGQHPTQADLDLVTVNQLVGGIAPGLRIALVGDLVDGRTARSLAYLGGKFPGVHFDLVAPPEYQMRQDILDYFDKHDISYTQVDGLMKVAERADIFYMTRLQTERKNGNGGSIISPEEVLELMRGELPPPQIKPDVCINDAVLAKMQRSAFILHPLPRSEDFNEIPEEYTDENGPKFDSRIRIFDQVGYGLYARMAILHASLGRGNLVEI